MATRKPGSKDVSKVETQAIKTSEEDARHVEQKAKSDDRETVFVRISRRASEILKNAAKASRTKARVIEALLENFDRIKDEELKKKILEGQFINPLEDHGKLLELRSWAEHAFDNDRYVWAGGMYEMLANHPSSSEGLKNICHYKLSVCLIRQSYAVRKEALKGDVNRDVYGIALDTLDEAIYYTEKVEEKLGNELLFPRMVLYYNLASSHSLKAQYMVESALDPTSILVDNLRSAEDDSLGRKESSKLREDVWKTIGENWRSNLKGRKIDDEAEKAFYELKKIFSLPVQETTEPEPSQVGSSDQISDKIWMVDSADGDEDFIFLRSDKQKWQPIFKGWTSSALEGRQPNAAAVRDLMNRRRRR